MHPAGANPRQRGGKAFLSLADSDRLLPPVRLLPGHQQVACLAADGRLLVYPLTELKLQPAGGKGLTLMEVDATTPLLAVATLADSLRVLGSGRGGKAKEELLKPAALAAHQGKRARKGRPVAGLQKVLGLAAL